MSVSNIPSTLKRPTRDDLVLANRSVAEAIARRYRNRGIAEEDLTQVALEGLVKAAGRFDPTLEHDFLSYAVPVIRGEIQRHFRDHGWAVRPTRSVQELQWSISRATEEMRAELGREPDESELVERLGVTAAAYREAMAAYGCFQPSSLDRPVQPGSSRTVGDVVRDDAHDPTETADAQLVVNDALRVLTQRERRLLQMRYVDELTQSEIGDRMGMTQVKVSRVLRRVLDHMRSAIGEYDGLGSQPT